jgi:RecA/RadA recombinase
MKEKPGKKTAKAVDEIFSQLIGEQNNLFPGAAVSGEDMFSDVKIWIPTGSSILDTIISNQPTGGWPCGRVVEVYGQEAIGKSTLAFQAMANCQKMGGIPIYFDVEQAGSRDMMKACGVDLNRTIISGLTSIEEIFAAMEQNLTTIINNKAYRDKPIFICLDSLAQMTTDGEIEAGFEANMNIALAKAKQIGKALRKISPFLRKANAVLYIVNQLRDKPGVMFGDPTCVDPHTTKVKVKIPIGLYKTEQTLEVNKGTEYVEVEMTLAELAKTYFNINEFKTDEPVTIPIDDLGILIESFDEAKNEKCFKLVDSFILKPSVENHYTDGVLKGTSVHRIIEGGKEIYLKDHPDFKNVNESIEVVDISVIDTECYYANGRLNHNTTPGGNSVKFAASVRIKLQGKTPVVESDPFAAAEHAVQIKKWDAEVEEWKSRGKAYEKPEKPKKAKGDDIIVGYDVTARTDKNKVGPPRREAEFRIVFSQGIIEEDAWMDYSLKYNVVKQLNLQDYQFVNHTELGTFKRGQWAEMLADAELHEEVRKTLVEKLVRSLPLSVATITDVVEEEEVMPEEMKD